MHTDATVGARMVFDPAGVEAIVRFEFAPIRHWSSLERVVWWAIAKHGSANVTSLVSVTVGVIAFLGNLVENREIASWSGCSGCTHGYWHYEKHF